MKFAICDLRFAIVGVALLLAACGTVKVSPETDGRIAELLDDVIELAVARGEVEQAVVSNEAPPVVVVSNTPPVVTNAPPAPPPAGILRAAKWNKFPRVDFDAPEIERWPRTGDKNVCAQLFLNGRKVEWIAAGRQWSTVHNATVPGKYHRPEIKSGDVVTISIADLNGKNESNRIQLIWP